MLCSYETLLDSRELFPFLPLGGFLSESWTILLPYQEYGERTVIESGKDQFC